MLALALLLFLTLALLAHFKHAAPRRPRRAQLAPRIETVNRSRPKPAWVRREVLRLAALTGAGCRTIEKLFNRLHASSKKMTVSKSYVHYTMHRHRYEIDVLRRQIKHRPPRPVPRHHVWAVDMTGKGDAFGEVHAILGIVDHGSRRLLALEVAQRRNAWTLLGHVFLAIGAHGKPRMIRSDNDAVFTSRVFRTVLRLAGIRQQFTAPGCPWMNGRIERLFGTLKEKLDRVKVDGRHTLKLLLADFRFWYNRVRPHQNLGGLTPFEAWHGVNPYANPPNRWSGSRRGVGCCGGIICDVDAPRP